MKALEPRQAARDAVAASPTRPATAVIHDSDDVRLIVFRIAPGQSVPPHRSPATVLLSVLEGTALLSGEREGVAHEDTFTAGGAVLYGPDELHGMRATNETVLLLATITPRPGTR
jgi:quercetin dioxygenase-like cupin family protein